MRGKHATKHYKVNTKLRILKIFAIIMIINIAIALNNVKGILSYSTDTEVRVNQFTIEGTYIIHYDANNGTGTMPDQIVFFSTQIDLIQNEFTRQGYNFNGWNTDSSGNGTSYTDGQSVSNLTNVANGTVNLYAQWEEEANEAQIVGGQKYETLQEALTTAKTLGGHQTVRILKNIQLTSAAIVSSGSNITLDLQNFTISNGVPNINIIKNSGTLEVIGGANGTITSNTGFGAIDNDASGNLTVRSGRIVATGERQAIYNAGGIVEVTGSAYLSSAASDRATIQNYKPDNGNAGTVTISGGTIISTSTTTRGAIENAATGTVIITGGTITSDNAMGVDSKGTIIIGAEDGDVDITTPVIQGTTYGVKTSGSGTVEIYDGIVKGQTHAFNDETAITDTEDNFHLEHGSENIGGNTYETAYLDSANNRLVFYGNGGTPAETVVYLADDTAIGTSLPSAPTRPRYSFDGWFTDLNNGTQITSATVINSNGDYYAHWTQVQAEVTYNANGGTMDGTNEEDTVVLNCGASIGSANLPTPTRQYKSFVGWFTDPDNGTQIDGTETISQDVTYYAHWTAVNVTVNFDANQGTIPQADASRTVEAGDPVGSLPITATRSGYYFAGWFTDPTDGEGTRIKETEIIGTTTTTYYAHWITTPVARIGAVHYETLQEAIRDVSADNTQTTILLLQDQIEAVEIITNQNIVLDLQTHKLYNNGTAKLVDPIMQPDKRAVVIENYGTLTITNGTLSNSTGQGAINNYYDLTLDGITLTITGKRQGIYNSGGTVLITGNSYLSATSAIERALIQGYKPTGAESAGTITIDGATLVSGTTSDKAVIENPSTGTVIILDGTVTSTNKRGIDNSGTLTLGTEDGTAGNITPVIQGKTYGVKNNSGSTFNFYDGIVKGVTGSISGSVSDYEDGASRTDGTETIGTDTYNTTCYQ